MRLIKAMRRQKCIYWECTGVNPEGQPAFADPVVIACRWDDTAMEAVNPDGEKFTTQSVVYPDRVVPVGSFLMLASEIPETDQPVTTIPGALRVRQVAINPTLRAKQFSKAPNYQDPKNEVLVTAYL